MNFTARSLRPLVAALSLLSAAAFANELSLDARALVAGEIASQWGESSAGSLYCTGGGSTRIFEAQLPIPDDARVRQFAVWGGDTNLFNDVEVVMTRVCQPSFGGGEPAITIMSQLTSNGDGGAYYDSEALDFTASDTDTCAYFAQVIYPTCITSLTVAKLRVRYTSDVIFANAFD